MKYRNTLIVLGAVLLLGLGTTANAANEEETARLAEEKELQARLEAEYQKAISTAKQERLAADGEKLGMQITIQREDVFRYMHRI